MGMENITEPRLSKPHSSVDLYRPPALRNHVADLESTASPSTTACVPAPSTFASPLDTAITSKPCNNSPLHAENHDVANAEQHPGSVPTLLSQDATEIAGHQRQQTARRERRPDRAVYVPRARRSQTTPPTTTIATPAPATATAPTTTTVVTSSTSGSNNGMSESPTSYSNANTDQHQLQHQQQHLPINTSDPSALVSLSPLTKLDEAGNRSVAKKLKSSHQKERKERTKKSTAPAAVATTTAQTVTHTNLAVGPTGDESSGSGVVLIAKGKAENPKVVTNFNCDSEQHKQTAARRTLSTSAEPEIFDINHAAILDFEVNSENIIATIEMNKFNAKPDGGIDNSAPVATLRIEDVVQATQQSSKCDNDEQELQRASKEINRSNRRIMKQTFMSDVLEIPEKFEQDDDSGSSGKLKNTVAVNSLRDESAGFDITTEEEGDDEEDDWEQKYDESGECLDPKIIEELTASVGKVKIELPKMDYNVFVIKQAILNEEEFPHVLEVSNFPVEFKNQDLLMIFSQYKQSGFDIKWVDDTHALAVFSSPRIAAEVLTMGHPFVVLKPLAEATIESRLKAKKCATSLQPYRPRPETCAALARRLVTGALGVRLKTAAAERENEKRVLREAKERKLLAAKQRDEIWEN